MKITNKAIKNSKKHICLGIYNSKLNPKILTEMIAKYYLIIAYYM